MTNLTEIVQQLISTKREGDYWDFKASHHQNNADLLHDIISLANSTNKQNKFLIFGVADVSKGCEVLGLNSDNRKQQTHIIDFLRSISFSNGMCPEIELKTIRIDDKPIDVLIIFDRPFKPYYLEKDYRDQGIVVKANYIYTRTLDTNTPINQSAPTWAIEKMWRERFGLDMQPAERFVELLRKPFEWDKNIGNNEFAYHKYHPEFQIQFGEPEEFREIYSFFYINPKSFIGTARFKYLNTELFSLPYVYCDEMRVIFPDPKNGNISIGQRDIWYKYINLDSRNGAFLDFLTDSSFDFKSRGGNLSIILYRNDEERLEFENYLKNNVQAFDEMEESRTGLHLRNTLEQYKEKFFFDPVDMIKVTDIWKQWKVID